MPDQPTLDIDAPHARAPRSIARTLLAGRPLSSAQIMEAGKLDPAVSEWVAEQQALIVAKRMEQGLPVAPDQENLVPAEAQEEYRQERRADVAQRVREWVARNAECGPIPMCMNPERTASCADALMRFGYTYFVGRDLPLGENPRKPSAIIEEYVRRLQTVIMSGGSLAVALPRGYAKTAWATIAAIWGAAYGHADYIVLLAANDPKAKQLLGNVKHAIESNELLYQDFPELCHPVRSLEGNIQRCASQLVDGKRTRIEWGVHWVVCPTIEGSKCAGNIIAAYSIDSGFHGIVRQGRRPKVVIADDCQTEQTAHSPSATRDLEHRIVFGAMGLGSHDRPVGILMACTCIEEGDLSDRFLDPSLHPEFAGLRMRLVLAWPARQDLWDAYAEAWREDSRNSNPHMPLANALYAANRTDMDAGAEISDPDLYDHRTAADGQPFEQSAMQHAWNLRLRMKDDAYFSQIENSPRKARGAGYELSTMLVASRCNKLAHHVLQPGTRGVGMHIDVNAAAGLRWVMVAAGRNMTCSVVDYGRWPVRGRLCPPNASDLEIKRRVYAGLAEQVREIEGFGLPIRALSIDRGYQPDTIHAFARNTRARFPIIPSWGFGASRYRPEGKSTVGDPGYYCHLSESPNGQFLAVQVDFWREVVQRSFLAAPLSPGSLSLWGSSPTAHQAYAENITSKILADKATGATGSFWKWHDRPGAEDHWLDATVCCYALLSWFRYISAIDGVIDRSANASAQAVNQVRPRRYRETRKAEITVE